MRLTASRLNLLAEITRVAALCALAALSFHSAAAGPVVNPGLPPWLGDFLPRSPQTPIPLRADVLENATKLELGATFNWPRSKWLDDEKATYTAMLSSSTFEVMVVPAQVVGHAIDRPGRAMITGQFAQRLELDTGRKVADPWIVARALGEGRRTLDPDDVYRLANALKVRSLIWIHLGHRRDGTLGGRFKLQARVDNKPLHAAAPEKTHELTGLTFTHEDPPYQVLAAHVPAIFAGLGLDAKPPTRARVSSAPAAFPRTPADGIDLAGGDALASARHLQLLGAMLPHRAEHHRARLFARSMVALDRVASTSSERKTLEVRGLYHLQRRPAAIKLLGKPDTPEQRALLTLLNGDRPAHAKAITGITDRTQRLIAEVEHARLRSLHGLSPSTSIAPALVAAGTDFPEWQLPLKQALFEADGWRNQSNAEVKAELDRLYPLVGMDLETLTKGLVARGATDTMEIELSPHHHVNRLLAEKRAAWCCRGAVVGISHVDVLAMFSAYAEFNLEKQVEFLNEIQGTPEPANTLLDRIAVVYEGHPEFTAQKAAVLLSLMGQRPPVERDRLGKLAAEYAIRALYWGQGQILAGNTAGLHGMLGTLRVDSKELHALINGFIGDHPFRPYWSTWEQGGRAVMLLHNALVALRYATDNFGTVEQVISGYRHLGKGEEAATETLLKSVEHRFVGDPRRAKLLVARSERKGDAEGLRAAFRQGIEANP